MKKLIFCFALLAFFVSCEPAVSSDNFSRITGQVLHHKTGKPVDNAKVYLVPGTEHTVHTGSDGYFDFQRVEPGNYSVWADKDGCQDHVTVHAKAGEVSVTVVSLCKDE